jgi:hypothetical protein
MAKISMKQPKNLTESSFHFEKLLAGFCPPSSLGTAADESDDDQRQDPGRSSSMNSEISEFAESEQSLENFSKSEVLKEDATPNYNSTATTRVVSPGTYSLSKEERVNNRASLDDTGKSVTLESQIPGNDSHTKSSCMTESNIAICDETSPDKQQQHPPNEKAQSSVSEENNLVEVDVMVHSSLELENESVFGPPMQEKQPNRTHYFVIFFFMLMMSVISFHYLSNLNGVSNSERLEAINDLIQDTISKHTEDSEQQRLDQNSVEIMDNVEDVPLLEEQKETPWRTKEKEERLEEQKVVEDQGQANEEAGWNADQEVANPVVAEDTARLEAEEIARLLRTEKEAHEKAEAGALLKGGGEACAKAEARLAAEAEKSARLKTEENARLKAAEDALVKAEEEARLAAEAEKTARLKTEEDARLKAAEDAIVKAEEEARLAAEAEEAARMNAEEDARLKAEEGAPMNAGEKTRIDAEEEVAAGRLVTEDKSPLKAEEEEEEDTPTMAEEETRFKTLKTNETGVKRATTNEDDDVDESPLEDLLKRYKKPVEILENDTMIFFKLASDESGHYLSRCEAYINRGRIEEKLYPSLKLKCS